MRFAMLKAIVIPVFALVLRCSAAQQSTVQKTEVLFICEHGNVKSLMAASYFNQLAQERSLPYRALARGTNPNSTTVPPGIINGLRADGIDVSSFHPSRLRNSDISKSARIVAIGVELPPDARQLAQSSLEEWTDVPSAALSYAATQEALKTHVAQLIDKLSDTAAHPSSRRTEK